MVTGRAVVIVPRPRFSVIASTPSQRNRGTSLTDMEPNEKTDPRNSAGKGSRDAVQFECPTCKAAMHLVVSRLRRGSKVQCAACKSEHTLSAADVPRLLAEHRKRLGKLKT